MGSSFIIDNEGAKKTFENQCFFFPRENQNPFRENFWQFLAFHPWNFFSFRENFLKSVREKKNVYVKISLKTHTWKQKRVCVKKKPQKNSENFHMTKYRRN